jgi:hypothetical protein
MDNYYFDRLNDSIWGKEIVLELSKTFNFANKFCECVFKNWAFDNGLTNTEEIWVESFYPKILRTRWSPEITNDVDGWGVYGTDADMLKRFVDKVNEEIDSDFLRSLDVTRVPSDEIITAIKCEGYILGPLEYNPDNFGISRTFIIISPHDILLERKYNVHYQNWLKGKNEPNRLSF